jgi:hypothetical protein
MTVSVTYLICAYLHTSFFLQTVLFYLISYLVTELTMFPFSNGNHRFSLTGDESIKVLYLILVYVSEGHYNIRSWHCFTESL